MTQAEQYWEERYKYWLKAYSAPGTTIRNMTVNDAAIITANRELERWQINANGPQIKFCCDELKRTLNSSCDLFIELPSKVEIDTSQERIKVNYCTYCGTKVEPHTYNSPPENPFNQ